MHFAIHGAEVQVPALKGMTVAEARSQTAGLGPESRCRQSLLLVRRRAGTHPYAIARAGHSCAARMASARSREPRPAESGRAGYSRHGRARCGAASCGASGWGRRHCAPAFGAAPEGAVLAQDPPAHAQGIAGPSINLLVAAPDDDTPDGFVMPDLTGVPSRDRAGHARQSRISKTAIPRSPTCTCPTRGTGDAQPSASRHCRAPSIAQQPPAGARVDQTRRSS